MRKIKSEKSKIENETAKTFNTKEFNKIWEIHSANPFNLINPAPMIKNYIKIAIRNLFKHKLFSIVTLSGLILGMTGAIL
ncbi:MAG: hypothetical protein ACRC2O_13645, partial [Chitinophagaceae bacterium]